MAKLLGPNGPYRARRSATKESYKIALSIIVCVVVVAAAIPLGFYIATHESHFDFSMYITNRGSAINGMVLIVPIPQAPRMFSAIEQAQLGVSVSPAGPSTYSYALESINTTDGEIKMLRIWADFPESPLGSPYPSLSLGTSFHVNHRIDTSHPVGEEPMLEPVANVTRWSDIDQSDMPLPFDVAYDSLLYTNFASNISTTGISVNIMYSGWNEWFMVIGWAGSSFLEQVSMGLTSGSGNAFQEPAHDGWNTVRCCVWADF